MPSKLLMWQIAVCLFSCLACTPEARDPVTAEEIIAKYVEAIGGRAALDACKTRCITGKATFSNGVEAKLIDEVKQPDKFRLEMKPASGESTVHGSDGLLCWWVLMGQPQEMPEDVAKHLKNMTPIGAVGGPLVAYRAKGHRVEFVGKVVVEDRPVYKLKLICKEDAEGDEEFHFIDAETFLLSRIEAKKTVSGQTMETIRIFSDYRRVDGLMFAFAEKEFVEQHGGEYVRIVEQVELNVNLPDGHFAMPKPEAIVQEDEPIPVFENEPAGRALYDAMIAAMRDADSLYYESDYRWEAQGRELGHATYRAWLKKPNQFRVEALRFGEDAVAGVLVGDGDHLWIHWPAGKPRYGWENFGEFAEQYEKYRLTSYMKKRTPVARHSIGHEVGRLGAGMSMTIIDPSTFHGYTDSLQPYLDGVRHSGTEAVDEEQCDVIEVSLMKGQRIWHLWLSKKDHLPRKLKQVVRVSYDIVTHEVWSNVAVNAEISLDKLAWSPPEDWREWKMPPIEAGLLKPGKQAPDFAMASLDGGTIRLSDYRGSYVWMFKWRVG